MTSQFRKKPVVIEATQWFKNGDHPLDGDERFASGEFKGEKLEGKIVRYFRRPDKPGAALCEHCTFTMHEHGWIDTLEGGHIVCPGDWIITGVKGEHYPCKPDIFAAAYEPANTPRIIQGVVSEDAPEPGWNLQVVPHEGVRVGDRFRFSAPAMKFIVNEPDASTVVVRASEIITEADGCKRVIVVPE